MRASSVSSKADLVQYIESESERHLGILQKLIQTPTPNPPGDTKAAIEFVENLLQQHGITTEIIAPKENSPNLLSVFQGGKTAETTRSIVLNGHIDQFPVGDADQWEHDPYSGDIENGYVHGRSGVDMKAGTAASVIAFSYLFELRDQLLGNCVLEVVSDEETGGRWGTRHLIEEDDRAEQWKGDCVLIAEPSGLDSIRFGEKGTLRLTFTVTAQDGHGAYIHRSEGAIRRASRLIQRLVALEVIHEGMDKDLLEYFQRPEVRRVANEIMWAGAADAMLIPTVNIGTICGGAKINMIPGECVFEAEIRIPIGVETQVMRDEVDRILEDFPGTTYAIHVDHSNISTYSPREHELVTLVQKNALALRGNAPIPICSLGATDCKHFRRNGVPAYAYGLSPRGMGERNEKVSVEEFLYLIKVHTLTAWDYLGGPP